MSTRGRTILIIFVGLVLFIVGVGTSFILINRINAQTLAAQQQAQLAGNPVVVTTKDLHLGDKLTAADLTIVQVSANAIPSDALSSINSAVGKMIKADLSKGEMVLQHNLADPTNTNHDLSYTLGADQVLMAFPATDLMSTDAVIQRGDVIDIYATFTINDNNLSTPTPSAFALPTAVGTATSPTTSINSSTSFTTDVLEHLTITAVVTQVITDQQGNATTESKITSYLLALNSQDALVLKYLKDNNAVFDIVIRAPTSQNNTSADTVDENYLVKHYSLSK